MSVYEAMDSVQPVFCKVMGLTTIGGLELIILFSTLVHFLY